jgi:hypothetical protein
MKTIVLYICGHISIISAQKLESFFENVVNKIKKKLFHKLFFFFSCVFYETLCKNVVQPERPLITIWRLRIVFLIHKATNTQSEYVILIAFPLQLWLHERASFLRYAYRQSCSELRKQIRPPPHPFKPAKFSSACYHLSKRPFRLADSIVWYSSGTVFKVRTENRLSWMRLTLYRRSADCCI